MWYHLFKYVLVGPVLRLLGRPTVVGREHLPAKGPVILAGNHLAVADSFYLCLMVRRRIIFIAKSEYFTAPGIKGRMLRWFYSATGQVPVDRSGGRAAADALEAATAILRDGGVWGIYPEGTRSPDGRLYRGKTGAMRVALATGVPVLPVVVKGTETVNPPGSRCWRFGRVEVKICPPLDLSAYRPDQFRAATDHLMAVLREESGQEYVNTYAVRAA
ncbi:lysophospholipid acyltransferase family protein [Kribbella deserti]|uniref:lysophospholipid acyltransferase family protein n=1 Tax=Kribbella deserti TaxID=1926257 RepID=UPI0036D20BDF